MLDVATSFPVASVPKSAEVNPEKYTLVEVASKLEVVAVVKFCLPVHQLACVRASEATTAPVLGEMVKVPSELETEETVPPPAHEPNDGTPFASSKRQFVPALLPATFTQL